jgi:putative transposase
MTLAIACVSQLDGWRRCASRLDANLRAHKHSIANEIPWVAQVRERFLRANLGSDITALPRNPRYHHFMPYRLQRFQRSGQSHFVTFTCYHRHANFNSPKAYDLFLEVLEKTRRRFALHVYGFVVMPEHVHLLLSEPEQGVLADAIHYLKLCFSKRWGAGLFWQKRYYDRNVRNEQEFYEKLCYLHRNPVKRGLVQAAEEWKWSSFRHYALRENCGVGIESEWMARDRERHKHGGNTRIFLYPEPALSEAEGLASKP